MSSVAGGEGLHAGLCNCNSCMTDGGLADDYVHILADGTVEGTGEPDPDSQTATTGPAPDLQGGDDALNAGAYTFQKDPRFPDYYAYTDPNGSPMLPKLHYETRKNWKPGTKEYNVRPKKMPSPFEPSWKVRCTPAGTYPVRPHKDFPKYKHSLEVTAAAAAIIKAAEDEHVADLDLGWQLTAHRLVAAVNAVHDAGGFDADKPTDAQHECAQDISFRAGPFATDMQPALKGGGDVSKPVHDVMKFKVAELSREARDNSRDHDFPAKKAKDNDKEKTVLSRVDVSKGLKGKASSSIIRPGVL